MKFIAKRNILLDSINIVSKAVSTKKTLPILECVLLEVDSKGLKMYSNDLEMAIETSYIDVNVEEEGKLALEAKIFFEIIRKLPNDDVSISLIENNQVIIKSGKAKFTVMSQSGEDFPVLPYVEKDSEYKILTHVLKDMIRKTIFAVSLDESRPTLTGELFEVENGFFNVVAIDGYRASFIQTEMETENFDTNAIIPASTLSELVRILGDDEAEEISMFFAENHVLFELPDCVVVSRLLEGEFVKYKQFFPDEYKTLITVDRYNLLQSLERSLLMSRDKKNPVIFNIETGELTVTSTTEMGEFIENFNIEIEGDSLKIGFNPKYLMDILKAVDGDNISMQFGTSSNPCIIKDLENSHVKHLLLPLRLQ